MLEASLAAMVMCACGSLELPAFFSDGIVLQADADVAIWGRAEAGQRVEVLPSWSERAVEIVADDAGHWMLEVPTPAPGGPHVLRVRADGDERVIGDVLLGEVWLASGQSNMEMGVARQTHWLLGAIDWEDVVAASTDPELRFFNVKNTIALEEADDVVGSWVAASPTNTGDFSATAYFFARALRAERGVPVGVITADWGGTPAEAWTPSDTVAQFASAAGRVDDVRRAAAAGGSIEDAIARQREVWWDRVDHVDPGIGGGWAVEALGTPWQRTRLPGNWENAGLPGYDGIVWYRREVPVPSAWRGAPLVLDLGPIDDEDMTYVNGTLVGESRGSGLWNRPRSYEIPASLAERGTIDIAIRVVDTGGRGGLHGRGKDMMLRSLARPGEGISLAGNWHRRAAVELRDLPRRTVFDKHTPSVLFNAMIAPLSPYTLRGVIWYQGESNRGRAEEYAVLFPAMIEAWRARFDALDLPFLFVQIAPFEYEGDSGQTAQIRESQRRTLHLPSTAMVVTADVGDPADIHPRKKREVGERLALAAQHVAYGSPDPTLLSPVAKAADWSGDQLRVAFSGADGGLSGQPRAGDVEVHVGEQGWVAVTAGVEDSVFLIDAPSGTTAVRYLWDDACEATVFNRRDLPVSPFLERVPQRRAD